jgi:hemolysin activation/secretion protein
MIKSARIVAPWLRGSSLFAMAVSALAITVSYPAFAQKNEPAAQEQAQPAAQEGSEQAQEAAASSAPAAPTNFDIDEFRIDGADAMPQIEVEEAVYPFLGPQRTAEDVEKARAALEKGYHDKGYQTVSVSIPAQNVAGRVVVLKVTEGKVGRLRVANSRFFDINKVKKNAPSLQEGSLPNFNEVTKDIVALNQWPDRRITPALRAGVTPGTVDVDLNIEDTFPLHGSVELNNRQSPNTTPTRLSVTGRYDNVWQRGDSLNLSYQIAPERPEDATSFSGSYLGRVTDWTSVMMYGVKSDSDVATVGGMNVIGPGEIIGVRGMLTLPSRENYFHSLSVGADYKHFGQIVALDDSSFSSPITYYPGTISYAGTLQLEGSLTQWNVAGTAGFRGLGSDAEEFWNKRVLSNANFFHANFDLSNTYELPKEFQLYSKMKAQITDGPLVSSEQFSIGGADTVRGYYESEAIGDNGLVASFEVRTPDFGAWLQKNLKDEAGKGEARFTVFNEWRAFAFADAGYARVYSPGAEQKRAFDLYSVGLGTRFKLFDHLNGMVAWAVPLVDEGETEAEDHHVLFSVSGEF